MKIFKIVIGIFLLFHASSEYVSASHELSTFSSPEILIGYFFIVFFCAWMIGSGISKDKLKIRSSQFIKYFAFSLGAFLILSFVNLLNYEENPEIITINEININIAKVMNGSKRMIPDEKQRRLYCICIVTKIANDKNISEKHIDQLKSGKIDKILISLNLENKLDTLNLEECFDSDTKMNWTSQIEETVKKDILNNLKTSKYAKTNDLNKFCDCQITAYKKLSAKELSSEEFANSQKKLDIEKKCDLKSRIK